jgi:hypothetical protein
VHVKIDCGRSVTRRVIVRRVVLDVHCVKTEIERGRGRESSRARERETERQREEFIDNQ